MKYFYYALLLLPFFTFSQNDLVELGQEKKDGQYLIDPSQKSAIDSKGNFICIRPHHVNGALRNYFFESYDGLNFKQRTEIETSDDFSTTTSIEKVFLVNAKAYVFLKIKKGGQVSIRTDIIDVNTNSVTTKNVLEINKQQDKNLFKGLTKNEILINKSQSGFVLSVAGSNKETGYCFIKVLDSALNTTLEKKIYPDKALGSKNLQFLNLDINKDDLYLLYSSRVKEQTNYILTRIIDSQEKKIVVNKKADHYELIQTNFSNNNFIISGLYSKKNDSRYLGYSLFKINLDQMQVAHKSYTEFKNEDHKKYFTGLFKARRGIDLKNIFIDELGDIYITGQFYERFQQQIAGASGLLVSVIADAFASYFPQEEEKMFEDIFVTKINSKGEIVWEKVINMRSTTKIEKTDTRDYNYFSLMQNKKLTLFLNAKIDTRLNKKTNKPELFVKQGKRKAKTGLHKLVFGENGDLNTYEVLSNDDSNVIFKTSKFLKNDDSNIYVLGKGNRRRQLLKMKLE